MQTTTNYGLKIYEGTDLFNPLTVENVNTSDLDTIVKGVSNAAVGTATELLTGTVHALTRSDTARNVFHFTATANFEAGETFEVDGVQVTAKTPDGQNLSTGAYVINSSVLCILDGTLLTVIVNPAKALDSDKLDGHYSTYFATAGDLSTLDNQVGAISTKVGTGVLDVGSNCVDGINTLNTQLTPQTVSVTANGSETYSQLLDRLFALIDVSKLTSKATLQLGNNSILNRSGANPSIIMFGGVEILSGQNTVRAEVVALKTSGSEYGNNIVTGGGTFNNLASNTASGTFTLTY